VNYDVTWKENAYLQLVEIWEEARDNSDLRQAIRAINFDLSDDPSTKGESRSDGRRVFFAPPLAIIFRVNFRLNDVVIIDIWRFEPHRSG